MTLTDLEARMLAVALQQTEQQARDVSRLEELIEREQSRAETHLPRTAAVLEALTAAEEDLSKMKSIVARLEDLERSLSAHRQMAETKTQRLGGGRDPSLAREVTSYEHLEMVTEQHRLVTADLVLARRWRCALECRLWALGSSCCYVVHEQMVHADMIKGFENNLRKSRDRYRALLVVADADNLAGYESGTDRIRRDGDATVVFVASRVYQLVTSPGPVAPMQHLWIPR
ncbi:hypothetical protein PpBr36_04025 [Pyricularia pennisetigena]|uniref:hypothetical protein n=1 Tax=Pyricularia pennisetigena TaxID=1578925 RepID=UPI001154ACC6|nr:hypothetical protein PpBr36_04025 [Pyricularia pennisetigena]TLS27076.1 hypothetical protein PpBr36_04025 [Pyricularia pennisetigena]